MTTQDLAAKLWNLPNLLRDDGVTKHDYINELTFLFYLKVAKETNLYLSVSYEFEVKFFRWHRTTCKAKLSCNSATIALCNCE